MSKNKRLRTEEIIAGMFAPGKHVMLSVNVFLHDKSRHPDAGRIGRVSSESNGMLLVEFFDDDLIGKLSACILPKEMWLPVPEFCVEEYFPRAKKRGWRLSKRGVRTFDDLDWLKNKATEGG